MDKVEKKCVGENALGLSRSEELEKGQVISLSQVQVAAFEPADERDPAMMDDVLLRAEKRRERALSIVGRLDLLPKWSCCGSPIIVGAIRYGLVVALDIDVEIYSDNPSIGQGFEVMSRIASLPGVWQVRFSNELDGPDQGLYWRIRYRDEAGDVWKVDNWLLSHDHPHAHWAERFAEAMQKALADETRRAILEIKEALLGEADIRGIDVYRAVLEGGVRSLSEFRHWMDEHRPSGIVLWLPSA